MYWYLQVFKKYANFNERAGNEEYWMFMLFNTIFVLFALTGDSFWNLTIAGHIHGVLCGVYALLTIIPNAAVNIRRLHDFGKSGWMLLIVLIPVLGSFWLLILQTKASDPGENKFGPCSIS
jgi:uncharacterized membrane protein YhaH (DUF805 family)